MNEQMQDHMNNSLFGFPLEFTEHVISVFLCFTFLPIKHIIKQKEHVSNSLSTV